MILHCVFLDGNNEDDSIDRPMRFIDYFTKLHFGRLRDDYRVVLIIDYYCLYNGACQDKRFLDG